MFTHYLVTRFNLQLSGLQPETIQSPIFDEDWLKTRLFYFTGYCAPSVLSQTNQQFTWLIYFNPATPDWVFEQIESIRRQQIKVEFVFAADYYAMLEDLKQRIRQSPAAYVMTSRLDNDDVIGLDYIRLVQSHFKPQSLTLINFLAGFEWHPGVRVIKRWNVRPRNQFMTLIERHDSSSLFTIYGFPHWRPPENAQFINIQDKPAWIYIRHERNFSMDKRNAIPEFRMRALRKLSPVFSDKQISFWESLHYAIRWVPKMALRRTGNFIAGWRKKK